MDKKEFIFPGVILGLVLIIAIGLLLTQGRQTTPPISQDSTAASTTPDTMSGSSTTSTKPGSPSGTVAQYYPYGMLTLSSNQVAGFKDGLSIRPTTVTEDSRCPVGVMCIQAGTVTVTLKTSVNNVSTTQTISLGKSITVHGDTITFTSVTPARSKEGAPAASAYRFTFEVTPGETAAASAGPCYVGGCSQEICSDTKGQVSACLYSDSFACYRTATCARQTDGACGWTQTADLQRCLANPSANTH